MESMDRFICETIVRNGGCGRIICYGGSNSYINEGVNCPFNDTMCVGTEAVERAKKWLSEHPVGCEYCKKDSKKTLEHNGMKLSLYVTSYGYSEIQIQSPEHENTGDFEIAYCPFCGRKLEGV